MPQGCLPEAHQHQGPLREIPLTLRVRARVETYFPSTGMSIEATGPSILETNMIHILTSRVLRSSVVATGLLCLATPSLAHITLIAPNGGEVLTVGDQANISWSIDVAHNQLNWDIWYSTTGAAGPWIPIVMDLPPGDTTASSVHNYLWTVPDDPSTTVRVRVLMDNAGNDYEGISAADLTIEDGCCGTVYCDPSNLNSTGLPGLLEAHGSTLAANNNIILHALQLPNNQFGYPLMSASQASVPVSNGILCLGGQISRFTSNVFSSGGIGDSGLIFMDLANLPNPPGGSVMPGDTWNFQVWYRDSGGSNFTNGLSITFQ